MRTQSVKFLRSDNGRLFMFRYGDGCLYCLPLERGSSSEPIKVIDDVSPGFSLWSEGGMIYLLCSSGKNVILCLYRDGKWMSRPLFEQPDGGFSHIAFLSFKDTMHLIYSVNQNGAEILFIRSAKGSSWGYPVSLGDIIPFPETPFYIGRENESTVRIYFRTSEGEIKYRIFSLGDGNLSETLDFLSVSMPFRDISILTEKDGCHIIYLVRGQFSSQLIYKGIKGRSSSKAKLIWEGQLSGSCSLMKNNGRLYALIYDRTKCYAAFSDDNGSVFSAARNIGVSPGSSCVKAEYTDFHGSPFLADEIPSDISRLSFPVTDDIYPSFIPAGTAKETQKSRDEPSGGVKAEELARKITELNGLLSKRNDELASATASWKARYDALMKENSALKAELDSLRSAAPDAQTPQSES